VVGDTDSARLLLGQFGHGFPGVDNGDVVEHLHVAALYQREELAVRFAGLIKCNREVNEVQVEVLEAELSQAVVESSGHILRAMLRVPELGCDEDVFTLEAWNSSAESLLESLCDLFLVAVDLGKIEVTVASLESFQDGDLDLTRLCLPGAESQLTGELQSASYHDAGQTRHLRDAGTSVQLDGPSERHLEAV